MEALIKCTAMGLYKAIIVSNDQRLVELCNNYSKAMIGQECIDILR